MTKDQLTPVEAFIMKVAAAHPLLEMAYDAAEQATGSTWIDIHVGDALIVVEHRTDRGFGFSYPASEDNLYGTPSAIFLREVDEAVAHLEHLLGHAAMIDADEVRHGA